MKKVLLNTILIGFAAAIVLTVLSTILSIPFALVDYLLVFLISMFVYIIDSIANR